MMSINWFIKNWHPDYNIESAHSETCYSIYSLVFCLFKFTFISLCKYLWCFSYELCTVLRNFILRCYIQIEIFLYFSELFITEKAVNFYVFILYLARLLSFLMDFCEAFQTCWSFYQKIVSTTSSIWKSLYYHI